MNHLSLHTIGNDSSSKQSHALVILHKHLDILVHEFKVQIDKLGLERANISSNGRKCHVGLQHVASAARNEMEPALPNVPLHVEDVEEDWEEDHEKNKPKQMNCAWVKADGRSHGLKPDIPVANQVKRISESIDNHFFQDADDREKKVLSKRPRLTIADRASIRSSVTSQTDNEQKTGGRRAKKAFAEAGDLKANLKKTLMKPTYRVTDFYHTSGIAQKISRSSQFENMSLLVISLNGIWIGIDADYNKAQIPIDAHPVFLITDQLFCAFFFAELVLRFLSFKHKRNAFGDTWFIFDFMLVTTMVLETWVMNLLLWLLKDAGGGFSAILKQSTVVRLLRLLRLLRMARIAKLLRAMPEVMVVMNGIAAAVRTVGITLAVMMSVIYVFAIALNGLLADTDVAEEYFKTIPDSMHTLLICGVFPDLDVIMRVLADEGIVYWCVFLLFGMLATVTIMNMMIGVLVEVVKITADVEREGLDVAYLRDCWLQVLGKEQGFSNAREPNSIKLTWQNVWRLLDNHNATLALQDVGVDVLAFADFIEFIFNDVDDLTFPNLMEVALQFRSRNVTTVKDLVDLRRYLSHQLEILFPEQANKARASEKGTALSTLTVGDYSSRIEMGRKKNAGYK